MDKETAAIWEGALALMRTDSEDLSPDLSLFHILVSIMKRRDTFPPAQYFTAGLIENALTTKYWSWSALTTTVEEYRASWIG